MILLTLIIIFCIFGRGWDQFETNEVLFGVKSTFNEELYTTKLERGPQTRELEKQALRIAREIEGEDTHDLHLAEVCVTALLVCSSFYYCQFLCFLLFKFLFEFLKLCILFFPTGKRPLSP